MCDERERLIEYVYDECDDGQRAEIDRHLATCGTCRDEIAGLRATRQDLLAWEVPDHGSVWRPFAPPRLVPWYREVPAWAMATAAGLMFMIGVGGGMTAQVLTKPATVSAVAQVDTAQPTQLPATPAVDDPAVIRAELRALEARMLALVKANNTQFAQHVSTGGFERVAVMDSDRMLVEQVNTMFRKLRDLEARNRALESTVQQLSAGSPSSGGSSR
jgi:hypothetical protein